jgi:hypothetical protein
MSRPIFIVSFAMLTLGLVLPADAGPAQTVGLFVNEPGAFDGYTLISPMQHYDRTYLIDNEGRYIHSWPIGRGVNARLLDDGSIIQASNDPDPHFGAGGTTGRIRRMSWEGNLLWDFEYSSPAYVLHHDLEVLPNGNVLALAWEVMSAAEATQAGRNPALLSGGELWPEKLVEIEPTGPNTGDIVWEWSAWDHLIQDLDPTKGNYGVVEDNPQLIDLNFGQPMTPAADWLHVNGIDYNAELDQIMLSVRQFSELWVIDHSTTTAEAAGHTGGNSGKGGDLLYRWGNPQAYDRGDASDRRLFLQHDAQWIEPGLPGAGNIMAFNNGLGRPGGNYSSVDELTPPIDASGNYAIGPGEAYGPDTLAWSYTAPSPTDFFSAIMSGALRLPNGNTLICASLRGEVFEVTPAGEIVWRYVSPITSAGAVTATEFAAFANAMFRAHRYAPDHAGIAGQDLSPGLPLEHDTDLDGLSDLAEADVHGSDPLLPDTDADGCGDRREVKDPATFGGKRDPTVFWDFFDTPERITVGVWQRDRVIDMDDIFGVAARFASAGDPGIDPLSDPLDTGYHTAYDRTGPAAGMEAWDLRAADGTIGIDEVFWAVAQFGHVCN